MSLVAVQLELELGLELEWRRSLRFAPRMLLLYSTSTYDGDFEQLLLVTLSIELTSIVHQGVSRTVIMVTSTYGAVETNMVSFLHTMFESRLLGVIVCYDEHAIAE